MGSGRKNEVRPNLLPMEAERERGGDAIERSQDVQPSTCLFGDRALAPLVVVDDYALAALQQRCYFVEEDILGSCHSANACAPTRQPVIRIKEHDVSLSGLA